MNIIPPSVGDRSQPKNGVAYYALAFLGWMMIAFIFGMKVAEMVGGYK